MDCLCCQKYKDAENINRILTEEREQSEINFRRMETALAYKRKLQTGVKLLLSVDSFITINNIILNANNLELRKDDVKPAGCNRKYMTFHYVLPALTGLIDRGRQGRFLIPYIAPDDEPSNIVQICCLQRTPCI